MILRLIALCLSGAGAYALLRGMPGAFPPLVRSCLAVLLLVGGLGWWAIGRKADDVLLARGTVKPKLRDFLAMGMGVLALECGFLWVLSAAPEPLESFAHTIHGRLRPGSGPGPGGDGSGDGVKGNWLWQEEGSRALPMRTNMKPGATPEVFIRVSREEDAKRLLAMRLYVRAFALDGYRDGVWSAANPRNEVREADRGGWIRFGERREGEILHEVFHGKGIGGKDVMTGLQGMRTVRLPEVRITSDGSTLLPDISGPDGYRYLAGSLPLSLEGINKADGSWAISPVQEGGRLSELAAKAAGSGTALEKLRNIQEFLRNGYRYSLVTENPKNLDPMENFLFGEKKGHCEFFATAGALLARELGFETRIAYGWAGGEFFKESLMFVFRAREAHAWVEVKVPGYGWAVMEPTPPIVLGGSGIPRRAGDGEKPPSREEIAVQESGEEVPIPDDHVGSISLAMMVGFALLAAAAFILKAIRRSSVEAGAYSALPVSGVKAGYLRAWARACEDRGLKWPGGATLKRQLDGIENKPDFCEELLGYHYGVKYEGKPPVPESEARLTERIKAWE